MAEERWVMATDLDGNIVHVNMAKVVQIDHTTGTNKRDTTRLYIGAGEQIRVQEAPEHFLPPITRAR